MPVKDKIEVEMLSPVMASFIPDHSDIVDWEDADPLEGNELVPYQEAIAEKIAEVNRLSTPGHEPGNLMVHFHGSDSVREKVECITMGGKRAGWRFIWLCQPDAPQTSDTRGICRAGRVPAGPVQRWLGRKSGTEGNQSRRR